MAVGQPDRSSFSPMEHRAGLHCVHTLVMHSGDTHCSPVPWHSCLSQGTVLIIAEKLS